MVHMEVSLDIPYETKAAAQGNKKIIRFYGMNGLFSMDG